MKTNLRNELGKECRAQCCLLHQGSVMVELEKRIARFSKEQGMNFFSYCLKHSVPYPIRTFTDDKGVTYHCIMKLLREHLNDLVGSRRIMESGEITGFDTRLNLEKWDGVTSRFLVTSILGPGGYMEHVSFAPIALPPLLP